jgi:hypothetical protein
MTTQLIAVVACGLLVGAGVGIQAQEKMPDKMAHDKMGHKDTMKNNNGKSKDKKTSKMGSSKDKMGGKQNPK